MQSCRSLNLYVRTLYNRFIYMGLDFKCIMLARLKIFPSIFLCIIIRMFSINLHFISRDYVKFSLPII